MSELTLIIGNKRYSSWSLRPWLALRAAGIPFNEVKILLDMDDTKEKLAKWCPSGRVPTLRDGDLTVWDSLAIIEYAAELHPQANLWPADRASRARARSVSAEMHSSFTALRNSLNMNTIARINKPLGADVQADIDRICAIWRDCRKAASDGPFLFGKFSAADAMYAPVATRFRTYSVPLDAACAAYRDAVLDVPAMKEWDAEAAKEAPMKRYE